MQHLKIKIKTKTVSSIKSPKNYLQLYETNVVREKSVCEGGRNRQDIADTSPIKMLPHPHQLII